MLFDEIANLEAALQSAQQEASTAVAQAREQAAAAEQAQKTALQQAQSAAESLRKSEAEWKTKCVFAEKQVELLQGRVDGAENKAAEAERRLAATVKQCTGMVW